MAGVLLCRWDPRQAGAPCSECRSPSGVRFGSFAGFARRFWPERLSLGRYSCLGARGSRNATRGKLPRRWSAARAQIPRFQQQELFEDVPGAAGSPLPRLLDELEVQIETARTRRRESSRRQLERIRASVQRVMQAEERQANGPQTVRRANAASSPVMGG